MSTVDTRLEELGRFVEEARKAKGKSQTWLGARFGAGQPYISKLESGQGGMPTMRRLSEIAAALDRDVNDLLVRSGWPDVSVYVAELREMQELIGGFSGQRAQLVRMLDDLPDEAASYLVSYASHLRQEHVTAEDGPEYELGEDGEFFRVYRKLPPNVKQHIRGLTLVFADAPREFVPG